ncbi:hypothetical protein LQW54_002953 [Pestalotiopsis sp. IQ-011]
MFRRNPLGEVCDDMLQGQVGAHSPDCRVRYLTESTQREIRSHVDERHQKWLLQACICRLPHHVQCQALHRTIFLDWFQTSGDLWDVSLVATAIYAFHSISHRKAAGGYDKQTLVNSYREDLLRRDKNEHLVLNDVNEHFILNLTHDEYVSIVTNFQFVTKMRNKVTRERLHFWKPEFYMRNYPGFLQEDHRENARVKNNMDTEELLGMYHELAFYEIFGKQTGDHLSYGPGPEWDFFESFSFERREIICKTSRYVRTRANFGPDPLDLVTEHPWESEESVRLRKDAFLLQRISNGGFREPWHEAEPEVEESEFAHEQSQPDNHESEPKDEVYDDAIHFYGTYQEHDEDEEYVGDEDEDEGGEPWIGAVRHTRALYQPQEYYLYKAEEGAEPWIGAVRHSRYSYRPQEYSTVADEYKEPWVGAVRHSRHSFEPQEYLAVEDHGLQRSVGAIRRHD